MRLSDFRVLSFDCYGTLIDWESGILAALEPLTAKSRHPLDRNTTLEAFGRLEAAQEKQTPSLRYSSLLAKVHARLAEEWGVAATEAEHLAFGGSVPDWPAFPDSPDALAYLKTHFKLVILSNVDRESFRGSNARLGVEFDRVFTAEDIGSYKPDPRNFAWMLDALGQQGIRPEEILHTAQSLFHDHVPAKEFGLATAWIDRRHEKAGWGATPAVEGARYDVRFSSLAEMAQAHRASLSGVEPEAQRHSG